MADAHGSGPCVRKDVGVQLPPRPLAWSLQSQVGFTQVLAEVAAGGPLNAGRRTGQVVSEPARAQRQLPRTRRVVPDQYPTRQDDARVRRGSACSARWLVAHPGAVPRCSCSRPPVRDLRLGNRFRASPPSVGGAGRRPRSGLRAGAGRHHRARCGDPAGRGAGQHVTTALVVASAGGLGTAAAVLLSGSPSPRGPDWEGLAAQAHWTLRMACLLAGSGSDGTVGRGLRPTGRCAWRASLRVRGRTGRSVGGSGPLDAAHGVPPCGFGVGRDGRSGAQAHWTLRMACLLAGSGSDGTVGRGLRPTGRCAWRASLRVRGRTGRSVGGSGPLDAAHGVPPFVQRTITASNNYRLRVQHVQLEGGILIESVPVEAPRVGCLLYTY